MLAENGESEFFINIKHTFMFSLEYVFSKCAIEIKTFNAQAVLVVSVCYLYRRLAYIGLGALVALVFVHNMGRATIVFGFKY